MISKKQKGLIALKNRMEHILIYVGAIRTGKTLFASYGFAEMIIEQQKKDIKVKGSNRYAIVGQTNVTETVENCAVSVYDWLQNRGHVVRQVKNGAEVTIEGKRVLISIYSVNNKESYKRLQGGTYRSIFLDEAPLMNDEAIDTAIGRCLTFDDHKIVMTGNPEGSEQHWFFKKFLKKKDKNYHVETFEFTDNPINTKEKVEFYKSIFTRQMFDKKILGKWVATTGAIYPTQPEIVDEVPDEFDYILGGIDYGEVDATTSVTIGVKDDIYYAVNEYYHKNSDVEQNTIYEYQKDLVEYFNHNYRKIKSKYGYEVYCETAPSAIFNVLDNDVNLDYGVEIDKVVKSEIIARINATNILINTGRLKIHSSCTFLIEAFANATWKSDNVRSDSPSDNIDSLDAFEYGMMKEFEEVVI